MRHQVGCDTCRAQLGDEALRLLGTALRMLGKL